MADEVIVTVRIPELPIVLDPLAPDDLLALWHAGTNKTSQVPLSQITDYIATGGSGTATPSTSALGATFIHIVTAAEEGGTTVSLPGLAGQSFDLTRDGYPLVLGDDDDVEDYAILDAGGFKITIPGDALVKGQRFKGVVYSLIGGTPVTGPAGSGSFITGKVLVVSNLPMTVADHIGKLMQVRSGAAGVIITLPDLSDIPDNTIIPFESAINNIYQSTIKTRGGQNIYYKNQSATQVFIGPGENIWLYRSDDGFYMLTNYPEVGKISSTYKVGPDELLCDGSYISQSHYPRLYAWAQTLGSSFVSDTLRNTASVSLGSGLTARTILKPYRGCWGAGTGPDQFQLPDLMNVSIRGLNNDGGFDLERFYNHAGGFQLNEVKQHNHTPADDSNGTGYGTIPLSIPGQTKTPQGADATTGEPNVINPPKAMLAFGGAETRMDNVGMLMVVKV